MIWAGVIPVCVVDFFFVRLLPLVIYVQVKIFFLEKNVSFAQQGSPNAQASKHIAPRLSQVTPFQSIK